MTMSNFAASSPALESFTGANGTITGQVTATYEDVPHHGPIIPTIANGHVLPRTATTALSASGPRSAACGSGIQFARLPEEGQGQPQRQQSGSDQQAGLGQITSVGHGQNWK